MDTDPEILSMRRQFAQDDIEFGKFLVPEQPQKVDEMSTLLPTTTFALLPLADDDDAGISEEARNFEEARNSEESNNLETLEGTSHGNWKRHRSPTICSTGSAPAATTSTARKLYEQSF